MLRRSTSQALRVSRLPSLALRTAFPATTTTASRRFTSLFAPSRVLRHEGDFERLPPSSPADKLTITIIDRAGTSHSVDCKVGDNLLFLMRVQQEKNPDLFLEGACEASLACSTCHVILDDASYDALPEAVEKEEDLLDLAALLSPTSRLGCQVTLTKELDGMTVTLPKFSRNFYVDGHIPQPH